LGTFGWAVIGGALGEVLGLYQLRREAHDGLPEWVTSLFYWLVTGMMVLSGGLLALLYESSVQELKPLLAANVGASAPLIISGLTRRAPPVPPGHVG